jgi:hypothetical protein
MSRFARVFEDPEYEDYVEDADGDWAQVDLDNTKYPAAKVQEDLSPYATVNS